VCDVPGHKLRTGLLEIEMPALNRGQASQAEMRSLVIVVPNKFLHGAAACSEGKEPATV
jgi:hypothetical protein